ncbi:MAG: hypothetical protein U0223_08400 [Nitrospira sp.]|nr:hypothetical protein [Nitrospira sp.]
MSGSSRDNLFPGIVFLLSLALPGAPASAQQAEADVLLTQTTVAYDDQQYDKTLSLLDRIILSSDGLDLLSVQLDGDGEVLDG